MDQFTLIISILIGIIVQSLLLKWIISAAFASALSKGLSKEQRRQTLLLAKIAQKNGVPDEEINKIINLLVH